MQMQKVNCSYVYVRFFFGLNCQYQHMHNFNVTG